MYENAKQKCKTSIYAHLHEFASNIDQESSISHSDSYNRPEDKVIHTCEIYSMFE